MSILYDATASSALAYLSIMTGNRGEQLAWVAKGNKPPLKFTKTYTKYILFSHMLHVAFK